MSASWLSVIGSSGKSSRSQAFRRFHPAVSTVLFAAIIVVTMAVFHPVFSSLSLLGALAFGVVCRGVKAVGKSMLVLVPMVVLVAFLNPFFSPTGTTEVGHLFGRTLYGESLWYGTTMGVALCAMVAWMQNAAAVITMEDTMVMVGRFVPIVGLMMSMIARLVPRYLERGTALTHVAQAITSAPSSASTTTVRAARRFGTLLSWSMEESLITADAMAARGWRSDVRRTSYTPIRFARHDAVFLAAIAGVVALALWGAWAVAHGFSFYPTMGSVAFHPGMVLFALLMALPCIIEAVEVLRWRR